MTEPETQPTIPADMARHQRPPGRWFFWTLLLVVLPFYAYESTKYIYQYVQISDDEAKQWKNIYEYMLNNDHNPDMELSAFLKRHLNGYYKENGRYPDNKEGLAFINQNEWNYFNLKFDTTAPPIDPWGRSNTSETLSISEERKRSRIFEKQKQAREEQMSHLTIVGSVAYLSPIQLNSSDYSFTKSDFDLVYIYVNKRELPKQLLADLSVYENREQSAINRVDEGVYLYATDWVNAYYYNKTINKAIVWNYIIYQGLWIIPLSTLIIMFVLLRKCFCQASLSSLHKEYRQVSLVALLTGLGLMIFAFYARPFDSDRTMCYAGSSEPLGPKLSLGMFRQAMEGKDYREEKLGDLLNKFQERGIIEKDTADKIRHVRNIQ